MREKREHRLGIYVDYTGLAIASIDKRKRSGAEGAHARGDETHQPPNSPSQLPV